MEILVDKAEDGKLEQQVKLPSLWSNVHVPGRLIPPGGSRLRWTKREFVSRDASRQTCCLHLGHVELTGVAGQGRGAKLGPSLILRLLLPLHRRHLPRGGGRGRNHRRLCAAERG